MASLPKLCQTRGGAGVGAGVGAGGRGRGGGWGRGGGVGAGEGGLVGKNTVRKLSRFIYSTLRIKKADFPKIVLYQCNIGQLSTRKIQAHSLLVPIRYILSRFCDSDFNYHKMKKTIFLRRKLYLV